MLGKSSTFQNIKLSVAIISASRLNLEGCSSYRISICRCCITKARITFPNAQKSHVGYLSAFTEKSSVYAVVIADMYDFDEFAGKIRQIFKDDTITTYMYEVWIDLSFSTHCTTQYEMKELFRLLGTYDFIFTIHKNVMTGNPEIDIIFYGKKSIGIAEHLYVPT